MAFESLKIQQLSRAFDAPWPGPEGQIVTLSTPSLHVAVCPKDGARIVSLRHCGTELLRQYEPGRKAFQYGCFPMIPWVGRLRNGTISFAGKEYFLYQNKGKNAMHGMAHFDDWDCEIFPSKLVLTNEVRHPWPWPCKVVYTIELKENVLALKLELESTHGKTFPVDAGWHPWFLKDPDKTGQAQLRLSFHADSMCETGSDELPTGRIMNPSAGPWDDCFNFDTSNAGAELVYPGRRSIAIRSNCPALVVFDKQPDATCVNPMSGIPNGVNTDPHLIMPHMKMSAEMNLTFSEGPIF
ncbi:MAG TPA: aldose epimerase [Sutterella sp.]|nr:aldose epimerase [Sutterella sp.]